MQKTTIEWVRNHDGSQGYTWNPVTGCKHGCSYCYARKIATRFAGGKAFPDGFEPTFHPERLDERQPYHCSRIFVGSMCDLFGDWVPEEWIFRTFMRVVQHPEHTFIFLTKNTNRLHKFNPWPKNAWVGASATDSDMFSLAVDDLGRLQCRTTFLSIEPLLSWDMNDQYARAALWENNINWLIIGAQTQPTKLPERAWVENIEYAADKAGVPVFEKNSLAPLFPDRPLRQEFPKVKE